MTNLVRRDDPQLHIRYAGRSDDIPLSDMDLGEHSSDKTVLFVVAKYIKVPAWKLASYVVERHRNGNITVRPEAVFG